MKKKEQKKFREKLERAYHLRDFEIEMYWKRAHYFWGFLVVIYAGYFLLVTYQGEIKLPIEYELITCSIGCVMSFAWYLVNRGSKRWQEHWEKMINKYEEKIEFQVYNEETKVDQGFLKAGKFSVSRVNIFMSFIIFISWIVLLFITLKRDFNDNCNSIITNLTVLFVLVIILFFMYSSNKS